MKIKFLLVIITVGLSLPATNSICIAGSDEHGAIYPQNSYDEFFTDADKFLNKYVSSGLVEYTAVKKDQASLDRLVSMIANLTATVDKQSEMAFLINTYNILVIKSVIDNYPAVSSPLKVEGFFSNKHFVVRGEKLSLDDIEKVKLLSVYKDQRIHFVLVCAAMGCPPLSSRAYVPESLQTQIEAQTSLVLNDDKFIRVYQTDKKIGLSEIFKWYQNDFGGSEQTAVSYINKYREHVLPKSFQVGYYTYDWKLNDRK